MQECEGFPGLVSKTRQDKTTESVNYESFRRLCFKWQMRLHTAFNSVLSVENNDYVQVRNCLVVMTKLAPCFPLLKDLVESVEKMVEKVRDTEKGKRDELSLKAASYLVRLKMRNVTVYEGLQFHATIPADAKKKLRTEKPKVVEKKEPELKIPERKEPVKVEKREKKEEPVVPKEVKKEVPEREEGEVPPSPPHKKARAQSAEKSAANGVAKERKEPVPVKEIKEERKEYRETKEKREEERKEVRAKEKRDPTPSKKEEPVKELETPRRRERGLEDEEVGPALPPSMREERVDDRKRDQKAHKRSVRDEEQNGHSKVPRKDREQIESRSNH
ncbi:hypothetical protein ANCCEY_13780 [Ancylostoma ceylanicum]|uniref:THO complex subunitTHOC2 C-terminal domain-containing protein n=1 Tax=Ancylostoma ceylanicum TaxID=53326 RepID=A0A0D6L673_9BILA|nr:hypothetical protein ANCCEY_13780 [Ancylostoma ceylanicum]